MGAATVPLCHCAAVLGVLWLMCTIDFCWLLPSLGDCYQVWELISTIDIYGFLSCVGGPGGRVSTRAHLYRGGLGRAGTGRGIPCRYLPNGCPDDRGNTPTCPLLLQGTPAGPRRGQHPSARASQKGTR